MTHLEYIALGLGFLALFGIGLLITSVALAMVLWAIAEITWFADRGYKIWRQSRAGRPCTGSMNAAQPKPWEYNMRKRILMVVVLGAVFAAIGFTTGCASWFEGGEGIGVEWTDNLGNVYTLETGADGTTFYISPAGSLYAVAADGFPVKSPEGETTRIKKVEGSPPDVGTNPTTKAALRHVHEAVG